MANRTLIELEPNFVPAKQSKKKLVKTIIYYVIGVVISLLFIFPLFYMFAASTKTDDSIAHASNTIMMFIPDFSSHMFDNYKSLFTEYGIWKYALNSFIYAIIVIFFNVIVSGIRFKINSCIAISKWI